MHWNHTRGKRKVYWHRVKDFLDALPFGSLVADIGSGDGKYFGVNPNITIVACDRSLKLLQVAFFILAFLLIYKGYIGERRQGIIRGVYCVAN